jgi:diacylglycerol kinase family enzyme
MIHVFMNLGSGGGDKNAAREAIAETMRQAGREVSFHQIGDEALLRRVAQEADRGKDIVVAAGGDGTINTVAAALLGKSITMGIVPLGTFNYVARLLDIPNKTAEAARILVDGAPRKLHVGRVNQRVFLNNVGLGLYVRLIEQRERHTGIFGRSRLVAIFSALATLLRGTPAYAMNLKIDGTTHRVDAPLIFLCANSLQVGNLNLDPTIVQSVAQGGMAAIIVKSAAPADILAAAGHILAGTLEQAEQVDILCSDAIDITTRRRSIRLVIDGEIMRERLPLKVRVERDAIDVIGPHPKPARS